MGAKVIPSCTVGGSDFGSLMEDERERSSLFIKRQKGKRCLFSESGSSAEMPFGARMGLIRLFT